MAQRNVKDEVAKKRIWLERALESHPRPVPVSRHDLRDAGDLARSGLSVGPDDESE